MMETERANPPGVVGGCMDSGTKRRQQTGAQQGRARYRWPALNIMQKSERESAKNPIATAINQEKNRPIETNTPMLSPKKYNSQNLKLNKNIPRTRTPSTT